MHRYIHTLLHTPAQTASHGRHGLMGRIIQEVQDWGDPLLENIMKPCKSCSCYRVAKQEFVYRDRHKCNMSSVLGRELWALVQKQRENNASLMYMILLNFFICTYKVSKVSCCSAKCTMIKITFFFTNSIFGKTEKCSRCYFLTMIPETTLSTTNAEWSSGSEGEKRI